VIHGTEELQVVDVLQPASVVLFQEIEALLVDELAGDFESNLITPCINEWHAQVVKEHSHLLAVWWDVDTSLLTLDF